MDESPTRNLLPPEEGEHPPVETKRRRKKKDPEKKVKKSKGNTVHFLPTVQSEDELKELAKEDKYPLRNTPFAIQGREQKEQLKLHAIQRPLTPKRIPIVQHICTILARENNTVLSSAQNPQNKSLTLMLS